MDERVERVDEQDRVLGIVDRTEAIQRGWLHRIATTVCHDPAGRVLVHQRPAGASRFPGPYNMLLGGAVNVGESYGAAAVRELAKETGVHASVRFRVKYLCHGAISPYWLVVHEAVITAAIHPDPAEIARHRWMTETELRNAVQHWPFVPDGLDAYARYLAAPC